MSAVQRVGGAPTGAGVWESLEERFGPSDADREEWLAARRQGITATEVRDLWLLAPGRRALAMAELAEKKLGRKTDSFSGNKYTAWGKDREPVIAELVRERFGIEPESRLVRGENPRHLASPDGIGSGMVADLVIAEIKTSSKDITPGTPEFDATGYLAQMVWQMHVIGATSCLFVFEPRLGAGTDDDPFTPGLTTFSWVAMDEHDSMLGELLAIADEFLALLDAAADEPFVEPDIDEHLDTLAVNVLRGRELEAEAKALKEPAWKELQEKLTERGVPFQQESPLARITFTPGEPSESEVPDVEAAKAADPALFAEVQALSKRWNEHQAQYRKTEVKPGTAKLTVTQPKPPKR